MSEDPRPEPDRIDGAPHPRETHVLFGHAAAEAAFLKAAGRRHHAWLISGPRGVGKATLAWRIVRFLLAKAPATAGLFEAAPSPETLAIAPDHPVARRVAALSEPRLFLLRRAWDGDRKRLKSVITVDEVRRLKSFFELSAADGGGRVALVDAADEMNVNAANALLKLLEEPPAGSTLLLVSHQPLRLLPTIRSRCRSLRLAPLSPADMGLALDAAGEPAGAEAPALAELAAGSVGEALRLARQDGLALYCRIVALISAVPDMNRADLIRLADSAAGRGAEDRLTLVVHLIDLAMGRLARAGAAGPPAAEAAPGEAEMLARLAPSPAAGRLWAERQQALAAEARHGRAVNLDPAALILDMGLKINDAGRQAQAR